MKKRIGNDISFVWHIYRKDGETQVPESFADKDVEVKLISPLQRPVTIEDVSIATGVVTFIFKGKHQVTLGNYVAILQENRGEDGMVTLDVVDAVTLVPHSYMEEDGDDGDVIEATSVELTSEITAGGGGGIEQQQADWAQTDASAVDFIKNKPDLNVYVPKMDDDGHGNMSMYSPGTITMTLADEQGSVIQGGTFGAGGWSVYSPQGKFQTFGNSIYRGTMGFDHDSVVWEKTATQQIPAATTEANGLMSAEDKGKLNDLPTATQLAQELGGKADSADLAEVATSGSYNDLSDKPTIPAAQVQSDWNESDTTSKAYIKNKPTIPTVPSNVSAFINDAGYITEDNVDEVPTADSDNPVKSGGVYDTTPSITDTDAESDLDVSDEDGNVLMRLSGGHIITKNFDSSNIDDSLFDNIFKNKRISFLGDSITTFANYPGSNNPFYTGQNAGITNVNQTWWGGLCQKTGATINRIYAYGGGDIVDRLCLQYNNLFSGGTTGTPPDYIFILGGINDWHHGRNLGTLEDNEASDTTFYAAYKYLIKNLKITYPNATIICLSMLNSMIFDNDNPPTNNNQISIRKFCEAVIECAKYYSVYYLDLNCLVNININNYTRILADKTHPNYIGAELVTDAIIRNVK